MVCECLCFILFHFLTAIAYTCSVFSTERFVAWGEEGESWAHRGSCVLLRRASGLGNILGCKAAVGRTAGGLVLAFISCEDGEMECSGGRALCMPKQASPKLREIPDVG